MFLCHVHKQKRYGRFLRVSQPESDPVRYECKSGTECKIPGTWKCPKCATLNDGTEASPTCNKCKHPWRDTSLESNTIILSSVPSTHTRKACTPLKDYLSQWGQVETIRAIRGHRAIVRFATVQAAKRAASVVHKVEDQQMFAKLVETSGSNKRKDRGDDEDEEEKPSKSQKVAHGVRAGIRGMRSGEKKKKIIKRKNERKHAKRREKYREQKKKEREAGIEDKSGPKGHLRRERKAKEAAEKAKASKKQADVEIKTAAKPEKREKTKPETAEKKKKKSKK
uniref:RRM domain-containing protein n=1 Tax=Eutreptiella gymnastica TaxID=73025 RepID=A0A7S1I7V6_9EUGL|mmetsp:Transcript_136913/g.237920  ORF Transcript_136913/g.237920 Transcript_136913/m.237920 type:complete len:281 (+) Transcript_136913:32-874(+)